jgi:hypothetical protein
VSGGGQPSKSNGAHRPSSVGKIGIASPGLCLADIPSQTTAAAKFSLLGRFQAFSSLFKGKKKIVFARQGHQTMAKASISHLQSPNLAGAPNRG